MRREDRRRAKCRRRMSVDALLGDPSADLHDAVKRHAQITWKNAFRAESDDRTKVEPRGAGYMHTLRFFVTPAPGCDLHG